MRMNERIYAQLIVAASVLLCAWALVVING